MRTSLLAFLHEEDVAAYLARRFPDNAFPSGLARAVHQRTDGNPLFMVRVVDELVTLGVLAEEQGRWVLAKPLGDIAGAVPESLRQLIEKQVDRLEPEAQRLLEVASVLGNEFTAPSVAAGLDADLPAVEDCCEALARQGQLVAASRLFVRPDGTKVARYHFTHSLYPQALVERMTPGRRLRLHQRLAEWLERTWGQNAAVIAGPLARHFEEAGDYRQAIRHLRCAADGDSRRWAYQEAIARLTRGWRWPISYPWRMPRRCTRPARAPRRAPPPGRCGRNAATFDALATGTRSRTDHLAAIKGYRAGVLTWAISSQPRRDCREHGALNESTTAAARQGRGFAAYWRLVFYGRQADDARRGRISRRRAPLVIAALRPEP